MTASVEIDATRTGELRALTDQAVALAERMITEPAARSPACLRALLAEIRALQALLPGVAAIEDEAEAFDNMPV